MPQSAAGQNAHLTSGRVLARNTVWNLVGNGAPMFVALFCIPVLIRGLGKERFGVLALAWSLIGYAGLLDFGLGRALTQLVARKLGNGEDRDVPSLVWTSLVLMLLLGILGTVFLILFSPWLVRQVLNIPAALQSETLDAFYLLALSVPVVITAVGLRGLLEAHQRFDLVNALRVPMGIFSFAGPLLVLPFSKSLAAVVTVLVCGRVVGWLAHLLLCFRVVPTLLDRVTFQRASIFTLLRFGGWMTVTNTVGPLMVTFDRFLIGSLISITAVTYYVTPYELVTKISVIPGALTSVMFPAFSTSFAQDAKRTSVLFHRTLKLTFLTLFPLTLLIVVFARKGLTVWLGADFATHSTHVLQWLAAGVFVNGLALVPFTFLQGAGRPDITAKVHLLELPVYMLLLWWLVHLWGIEGAAIVWTGRVVVDAIVLFFLATRFSSTPSSQLSRSLIPVTLTVIVLAVAALPSSIELKIAFLIVAYLIYGVVAWFLILGLDDRVLVLNYLRQLQVSR